MNEQSLPLNLKPIFWSYNFAALNPIKDKRRIIINIINYGKWGDWQWLLKQYGEEEIKKTIEQTPVTEFRDRALKLISLLLAIEKFDNASRSLRS